MDKDTVHEPELPGVHTYKSDLTEHAPEKTFGGVSFTTPETTIDAVRTKEVKAPHHTQSNGKELFDVERAFNNEMVQEGTFVTDKRKSTRSISKLMKSAFTEWWGNTQKTVEEVTDKMEFLKPKEIPTVNAPEDRTNTLLKAAYHARQAPRDDHQLVVEKIRTFAHDAEVVTGKPFSIKEADEHEIPKWKKEAQEKKALREDEIKMEDAKSSPLPTLDLRASSIAPDVTRTSTPLAAYAVKSPVKNTPLKESFTVRAPLESRPQPQKTASPKSGVWTFFSEADKEKEGIQKKMPVPIAAKEERSETNSRLGDYGKTSPSSKPDPSFTLRPQTIRPESIPPLSKLNEASANSKEKSGGQITTPTTATAVSLAPLSFESASAQEEINIQPRVESARLKNTSIEQKEHRGKPLFTAPLVWSVVILGSVCGIFAAFYFESPFKESEEVAAPVMQIPAFLTVDTQTSMPLSDSRETFIAELVKRKSLGGSGVIQQYPVLEDGSTIATTEDIMSVLEPSAPGSFVRALTQNSMLGFVEVGSTQEPFIILQSQNFDVVFAGMLEWEQYMSSDLAPLFGDPVEKIQTPTSLKGTGSAHFVDALTSNRSIRILYNETGEERIVYALVNKNLIIITTSTEALAKIIGRIR